MYFVRYCIPVLFLGCLLLLTWDFGNKNDNCRKRLLLTSLPLLGKKVGGIHIIYCAHYFDISKE